MARRMPFCQVTWLIHMRHDSFIWDTTRRWGIKNGAPHAILPMSHSKMACGNKTWLIRRWGIQNGAPHANLPKSHDVPHTYKHGILLMRNTILPMSHFHSACYSAVNAILHVPFCHECHSNLLSFFSWGMPFMPLMPFWHSVILLMRHAILPLRHFILWMRHEILAVRHVVLFMKSVVLPKRIVNQKACHSACHSANEALHSVCVRHLCVTWLIRMGDMTHSWRHYILYVWGICVWHDSFVWVTWLIHEGITFCVCEASVCDMTHSYGWHDSFMKALHSVCVRHVVLLMEQVILSMRQVMQHTATHCNTLQHTATHCNTLQHAAAHCTTLPYATVACWHDI